MEQPTTPKSKFGKSIEDLRSEVALSPKTTKVSNDVVRSTTTDSPQVDMKDWLKNVLQQHPEVKELRERLKPLHRAASFAKYYNPGRKELKERLTRDIVIQLIHQHLRAKGFLQTSETLERESNIKYTGPKQLIYESRLVKFLKKAVKDTDKLFNFAIGKHSDSISLSPHPINIVFASTPPRQGFLETDKSGEKHDLVTPSQINDSEIEEHLVNMGMIAEENFEDDLNIWLESPSNIIYEHDKNNEIGLTAHVEIQAASLNKLVEALSAENKHDPNYLATFLMTYQSFTTPTKLFDKLLQRYHVPSSYKANMEDRSDTIKKIRLRVVSVMKKWIEDYFTDFDEDLLFAVKAFIQDMRLAGGDQERYAEALQNSLSKSENNPLRIERKFEKTPEPVVPKNIFAKTLNFFDLDEEEMARQLTLIEFDIFVKIKPCELLNQSWNKPKLKHRAQNVLLLIDRLNNVARWAATTILAQPKVKQRARALIKFVKIAKALRTLNNYNTLMAIIAGFNLSPIHRLKYTWQILPANYLEMYQDLEKLMTIEGSHKFYREALKTSVGGACIPYLGVHLTDLTFIDENPDFLHGPNNTQLINFSKRKLIYSVISQVQQLQQHTYNLHPVYQIAHYLTKGMRVSDDQTMYQLSLQREPRKAKLSEIQ